jgi:predicted nucleic acid-binding protein
VIDSSVVVDAMADDSGRGEMARERLARDGDLHAPHLIDLEFASALRRMEGVDIITPARANAALDAFGLLGLTRYPHTSMLGRVWELRANVGSYDAAYVALAEALGCVLVTADRRLAKVRDARCPVEVLR